MDLENGNTGFITIHRTLQEKSWYSDPEYLSLWIHLLISANHKNKFYQGVEVKRGQVKTGRIQLAEMTGINQSKIERILKHFEESEQQIEQQKTNKFRIITIKNYDKFQVVNNKVNNSQQQPTTKNIRATTENTTNNDNHVKNENKKDIYEILKLSEDDLLSFKEIRKKTKAVDTDRSLKLISNELDKSEEAGFTRSQCIDQMHLSSWRGFKSEWMANTKKRNEQNNDNNTGSIEAIEEHKNKYRALRKWAFSGTE